LDGGGLHPEVGVRVGATRTGAMGREEVGGGRLGVGRWLGLIRRRSRIDRMSLG
jgi:hypothetical protein